MAPENILKMFFVFSEQVLASKINVSEESEGKLDVVYRDKISKGYYEEKHNTEFGYLSVRACTEFDHSIF